MIENIDDIESIEQMDDVEGLMGNSDDAAAKLL